MTIAIILFDPAAFGRQMLVHQYVEALAGGRGDGVIIGHFQHDEMGFQRFRLRPAAPAGIVRDTLPDGRGGATIVNGLLIARLLDEKPARMKADLMRAASALRAAAFDLPARMPAVWTC